jgi:hypothetical protein
MFHAHSRVAQRKAMRRKSAINDGQCGCALKTTLNKSLLALFSGRESEVNSDSLPPNQSLA